MSRPEASEAVPYYSRYIDRVPTDDIVGFLRAQLDENLPFLRAITEEQSLHRYEPGKWSIREVLGHVTDTERVFAFRAFWFARAFDADLPGFDQDVGARNSGAHERSWSALLAELSAARASTVSVFEGLADGAWRRQGIASGNRFTVRAIAYIIGGHLSHHVALLKERYLTAR